MYVLVKIKIGLIFSMIGTYKVWVMYRFFWKSQSTRTDNDHQSDVSSKHRISRQKSINLYWNFWILTIWLPNFIVKKLRNWGSGVICNAYPSWNLLCNMLVSRECVYVHYKHNILCVHSYISQLAAPTTFNAFLILVIGLPIKAINYKLHIGYGCAYYTLRHKTMSKLGSAPKFTFF